MENENDTDYLFITDKLERETIYVCGLSLYVSVYEDFQKKFGIYRREETDKPNHFWKVTNYLHETSDVSLFDRVKVIIAFVWKKGMVEKPAVRGFALCDDIVSYYTYGIKF